MGRNVWGWRSNLESSYRFPITAGGCSCRWCSSQACPLVGRLSCCGRPPRCVALRVAYADAVLPEMQRTKVYCAKTSPPQQVVIPFARRNLLLGGATWPCFVLLPVETISFTGECGVRLFEPAPPQAQELIFVWVLIVFSSNSFFYWNIILAVVIFWMLILI